MDDRVKGPTTRRRLGLLLLALVTIALAVGAASCGGSDEETAAPPPAPAEPAPAEPPAESAPAESEPAETGAAEEPTAATCPADDGSIDVFSANDLESATIGQNISPAAFVRMTTLLVDKANAAGGISGCKVDVHRQGGRLRHSDLPAALQGGAAVEQVRRVLRPDELGVHGRYPGAHRRSGQVPDLRASPPTTSRSSRLLAVVLLPGAVLVAHASVSTFLEGRAVATFAAQRGLEGVGADGAELRVRPGRRQRLQGVLQHSSCRTARSSTSSSPSSTRTTSRRFINAMTVEEPGRDPDRVLLVVHPAVREAVEGERHRRDDPGGLGSRPSLDAHGRRQERRPTSRRTCTATTAATGSAGRDTRVAKEYVDLWPEKYGADVPVHRLVRVPGAVHLADGQGSRRADGQRRPGGVEGAHRDRRLRLRRSVPCRADLRRTRSTTWRDTCAEVGKIVFDESSGKSA